MKVESFYKAQSLEDAYETLQSNPENQILGGGAWMKLSTKSVGELISLDELQMDEIKKLDGHLQIGAMATLRELETNPLVKEIAGGALSKAAGSIMGVGVRNIATIGGTIVSKFGFSDLIPVLLALDAKLVFFHHGEISLRTFLESKFVGKDILTKIILKINSNLFFFKKVKTTALDFAILNITVGKAEDGYRIVLGSRPGVAMLADNAMKHMDSLKHPTQEDLEEVAKIASDELHFSTNSRAHEEYRKHLAHIYVRRGLQEVLGL